jgi:hypothetical protein
MQVDDVDARDSAVDVGEVGLDDPIAAASRGSGSRTA